MNPVSEELIKILLAVLIGGIIGAEREFRHRAAGFRTIIFICLGSTLFTMFSLELGGDTSPVRIAAHMVTGVGFLCAGVIMDEGSRVVGLTTASTIWFTAAMGMGIGGGQYMLVAFAIFCALIVLWIFPRLEEWIYNVREGRTCEMVTDIGGYRLDELEQTFAQCGLQVKKHKQLKSGGEMTYVVEAFGSPDCHESLMEELVANTEVKAFRY
jgi:putative Mg2+ transporter-C (MgtC) family protein